MERSATAKSLCRRHCRAGLVGGRLQAVLWALLGLPTFLASMPGPLSAQVGIDDPVLKSVEHIEITEHLDAALPLDLQFQDETGNFVPLGNYFDGEHPVVLNLAYFSCPMLCNLVVEGFLETLDQMQWKLGDEFQVLTVSIDPRDDAQGARRRKEALVEDYGRPDAIDGWHFLTGREDNIRRVAETVGFGYEWNDYRQEYAHGAALILLTPDGRVSRYIYGIKYDPKTVRLSLVEASDGKVGSTFDKLFLLCYHYDPTIAQYGPMAFRMMQAGGVLTLFVLAGGILVLNRARRRSLAATAVVTRPEGDDPHGPSPTDGTVAGSTN